MGQYYDVFNISKKIFIRPSVFGSGNKYGELSGGYLGLVLIGLLTGHLPSLETCEVDWCGDRVAIVHDETEEWEALHKVCRDVSDIVLNIFQEEIDFEERADRALAKRKHAAIQAALAGAEEVLSYDVDPAFGAYSVSHEAEIHDKKVVVLARLRAVKDNGKR